jgi:outer membrane protein assembly factor BamB
MKRLKLVLVLSFMLIAFAYKVDVHAAVTLPADRLIVFDENPYDGSPRGLFEVGFGVSSQFLVNVPIDTSRFGSRLFGFAYRPADGFAYAASESGRVFKVDVETGALTFFAGIGVRSLTINPADGAMYGEWGGTTLARFDPQSMVGTTLGSIPLIEGGIAASPDGLLYALTAVTPRKLIAINPATLQVVFSTGPLNNVPPVSDLEFTSDGRLFGVLWQDSRIYEFDLSTGASAVVAQVPNSFNGSMGIFAIPRSQVIPEPNSICIVCCSLIFISVNRWPQCYAVHE